MKTLEEYLAKARKEKWAVPHFNFSSIAQLNGIIEAARAMKAPVLLGTSEGERKFLGIDQAVALVRSFQKEGMAVFLNADHCHSFESAKEAVDAGYDSVHIDLSKESFQDNLRGTKRVVEYARAKNPEISVEGELGYLATDSSKIYHKEVQIPEESYTKVKDAVGFVKETKVDRFGPAVGTIHGIAANTPHLRFDLIEELRKALGDEVSLVMHGGSGVSDKEITKAIQMGFNNIHVSTELRKVAADALRKDLAEDAQEIAPYKYLDESRQAVADIAKEKMRLFGAANVL